MESQTMMRYAKFEDELVEHLSVGKLLDAYITSFTDVEGKSPTKITLHPLVWEKLRSDPTNDTLVEFGGVDRYYRGISVHITVGQYKIGLD